MTTSGFLPPSSRQGDWTWRPHSSPMREPTSDEPVKPTLSTSPLRERRSSPSKADGPSHWTRLSTPSGSPPARNSSVSAWPERRRVLGRLPDDGVAAQQRRDEVPGRHRDREVAGGDDRRHPDRVAEGEQLLVGQLAGHGLAVQPAPLGDEEVAGVDHLLHLAERLRVGLADLAREQARRAPPCCPPPGGRCGRSSCRAPAPAWRPRRAGPRGRRGRRRRTRAASVSQASQTSSSRLAGLRDSTRVPPSRVLAADDRSDAPRLRDAHAP